METYTNINSYYPTIFNPSKSTFEDFKIIKLGNWANLIDDSEITKYKTPHKRSFFEFSIGKKKSRDSKQVFLFDNDLDNEDVNTMFISMNQVFSVDIEKIKENAKNVDKFEGYIIAFKPSFMIKRRGDFEVMNKFRYFNLHSSKHYKLKLSYLNSTQDLLRIMYSEYMGGKKYSREILMGYLDVLLHYLNRNLYLSLDKVNLTAYSKITTYFEQELFSDDNKLSSINEYASRLNISPNYLSESVKKATGKSAKQLIINHKLIIAKSLLQQRKKSIAEIAYEMGFSEPTNFTKFFKQKTKQTPNQYRNSNGY